uniref:Poliovirus receptor-like n=1 Tax=Poecilia formosa TaxID=48698 RepID=A0A096M5W2_POEFO
TAQVADGSITVDEGGTTILPCKLTQKLSENDNVEQISWQRKTKGKPKLDNFFTITKDDARLVNGPDRRFKFIGAFAEHNGTLKLSNASVLDTGIYSCVFSIFPSGYPTIKIELTVRGKHTVGLINLHAIRNLDCICRTDLNISNKNSLRW